MTMSVFTAVGTELNKSLIGEINEYYLFHGTKQSGLQAIENNGLDSRLSNSAMFGQGVYFAESSTKADQYAGSLSVAAFQFDIHVTQQ